MSGTRSVRLRRAAPALNIVILILAAATAGRSAQVFSPRSAATNIVLLMLLLINVSALIGEVHRIQPQSFSLLVSAAMSACTLGVILLGQLPIGISQSLLVATLITVAAISRPAMGVLLIVLTGGGSALVFALRGSVDTALPAALVTLVVCAARVLAEQEHNELRGTIEMLDDARWAASELSSVVMRVEEAVRRAQITSMQNERKRIAREIHDSVGYALTGAIVQIELLVKVVETDAARDRLIRLERITRETLQRVREEVGYLRSDVSDTAQPTWRRRWSAVCDYFAECTRVAVTVNLHDNLDSVPDRIGEAVYKIIQEGLTNAYRHGRANRIDVSGAWKPDAQLLLLRISDDGTGASSFTPGNGITGIEERVRSLNGTIEYDTRPGKGFSLGVDIPWRGASKRNADSSTDSGRSSGFSGGLLRSRQAGVP